MGPVRQVAREKRGNLSHISKSDVPPITFQHFTAAFDAVSRTVSQKDLQRYIEWNSIYGSYKKITADD